MKLLNISAKNFSSYKQLDFSFQNQGLTLIKGNTGSGKSAFMTLVPWILYGVNYKGGLVDDIRSWGTEFTEATLDFIDNQGSTIKITRKRGKGSSNNDLYWVDESGTINRGKDIVDTQARLESIIRANSYDYSMLAEFNEFSETSTFFTAKAKDRREFFETLVSLEFPVILSDKASSRMKIYNKILEGLNSNISRIQGIVDQSSNHLHNIDVRSSEWNVQHESIISKLQQKKKDFEEIKQQKINDLVTTLELLQEKVETHRMNMGALEKQAVDSICGKCGNNSSKNLNSIIHKKTIELLNYENDVKKHRFQITVLKESIDESDIYLERESKLINPYIDQKKELEQEFNNNSNKLKELTLKKESITQDISDLKTLVYLSHLLRGHLLRDSVEFINLSINRILDIYFQSEFRVSLGLQDDESIEVIIMKNDVSCTFTQLSKGQRQLLRLCFAVSSMRCVDNKLNTSTNCIFLDEALDGLDNGLKQKAFDLLQDLSKNHVNVFVTDHNIDFQNLFHNVYETKILDGSSIIERAA